MVGANFCSSIARLWSSIQFAFDKSIHRNLHSKDKVCSQTMPLQAIAGAPPADALVMELSMIPEKLQHNASNVCLTYACARRCDVKHVLIAGQLRTTFYNKPSRPVKQKLGMIPIRSGKFKLAKVEIKFTSNTENYRGIMKWNLRQQVLTSGVAIESTVIMERPAADSTVSAVGTLHFTGPHARTRPFTKIERKLEAATRSARPKPRSKHKKLKLVKTFGPDH
eukprot:TRINITY_DN12600_c1_g2_i10.p1 TRINITY_DN12600_c1_g2~~TRINITY_DN12600_c1_g2_i10.p1  ORF type:complete len:223 (+),score=29.19 TRINITY_DN12600_c1_g2_i10:1144-1812(+)